MLPNHQDKIDIIPCDEVHTIPELFRLRVARSPEAVAYVEYDDAQQKWRNYTWAHMAKRVRHIQTMLDETGLAPGDRCAFQLPNGTSWIAFDIAALSNGLITVPLYAHDSPTNISYIIADSGARLCLVDTPERWHELRANSNALKVVEHVWVLDTESRPVPMTFGKQNEFSADLVEQSEQRTVDQGALAPVDVATLIYTSGTTGSPKGVMLSHAAILWNAEAVGRLIPPKTSDKFLSVLPLAHAFERTVGYYLPMMAGATVAYARSAEMLREDLITLKPTVLLAVPRLYERVYSAIMHEVQGKPLKQALVKRAAEIGWSLHQVRYDKRPDPGVSARFLWPVLKRLVARRAMEVFGGRLRVTVSGGAALAADVARFLVGLGLPLVEGYGLTEAGPVVTATTVEDSFPGSVGRPLSDIELSLGEESELIVRSPSAMHGYWGDPEKTARTLDVSGWLKTGDIGRIEDGRVFIDGRLKEIIVLSTGEKVNPVFVEEAIMKDTLFEHVCVVGNDRPCLSAIVSLDQERWRSMAKAENFDLKDVNSKDAVEAILEKFDGLLSGMPRHGIVHAVYLTLEPWTIYQGLLTPTLKVKRHAIEERYSAKIADLYASLSPATRRARAQSVSSEVK